jgi:hypothetical protein
MAVRAENPVHGSDQQGRLPSRLTVTITGHVVGAENLRDQAIFVNHVTGTIAPLDPELIEIRDAVGQLP